MEKNIALIRGDGIGPEIVEQAVLILNRVAEIYGHSFRYTDVDMGGNAIDKWGEPLPQAQLQKCLDSDSVLLGAVGGPKWNDVPGPMRPEKGLLKLRAAMEVYSNNRPAKIWPHTGGRFPFETGDRGKGNRLYDRPGAHRRHLLRLSRDKAGERAGRCHRHPDLQRGGDPPHRPHRL